MEIGIGAIAAIILACAGAIGAGYFLGSGSAEVEPLKDRINELTKGLQSSSRLIKEIEEEIALRTKLVENLRQDANQYQQLAALNKEQADAVAKVLQSQLEREGTKSFWKGAAVNFIFFIAGLIASLLIANIQVKY
jgi:hypothetical protein